MKRPALQGFPAVMSPTPQVSIVVFPGEPQYLSRRSSTERGAVDRANQATLPPQSACAYDLSGDLERGLQREGNGELQPTCRNFVGQGANGSESCAKNAACRSAISQGESA